MKLLGSFLQCILKTGVIAVVAMLVQSLCLWLGMFGLRLSLSIAICVVLWELEFIICNKGAKVGVLIAITACVYYIAIVWLGQFALAAGMLAVFCVLNFLYKHSDVSFAIMFFLAFICGINLGFRFMGDSIPSSEMPVEVLAVLGAVIGAFGASFYVSKK